MMIHIYFKTTKNFQVYCLFLWTCFCVPAARYESIANGVFITDNIDDYCIQGFSK
jgi:hypothetical protein